jgi:hypothetical protein
MYHSNTIQIRYLRVSTILQERGTVIEGRKDYCNLVKEAQWALELVGGTTVERHRSEVCHQCRAVGVERDVTPTPGSDAL